MHEKEKMSEALNLEYQAESLVQKIRHYLITMMGVTLDEDLFFGAH